jgi:hypothetical protein
MDCRTRPASGQACGFLTGSTVGVVVTPTARLLRMNKADRRTNMTKLAESSSNSNLVLTSWITQVEDCLAWAGHAPYSTTIDSTLLDRSIAVWRENLLDREIEVDDLRRGLDAAVSALQDKIRDRDRAVTQLAKLIGLRQERA